MVIRDAIVAFLERHFAAGQRAERTRQAYAVDLGQFCDFVSGSFDLGDADAELVERWIAHLHEASYAPASIQRKLSVLSALFSYCERRKAIPRSPMALVQYRPRQSPRPPRTLSRADTWRLLAHARSLVPADYAETRRCSLRGFVALRNRVDARTRALFPSSRGQRSSTRGIRRMVLCRARDAGVLTRVTPHMLRHTAATQLLRNGVHLRIVQEFLGHASITTTQRYTHVSRTDLLSALQARHPLLETWSGNAPLRFAQWDRSGNERDLMVSQLH